MNWSLGWKDEMWYLCSLVIVLGENTLQNWLKTLPNSKQYPYNQKLFQNVNFFLNQ
jgi:hypothetical protein